VHEALTICREAISLAKATQKSPKLAGMYLTEARCLSKLSHKKLALDRLNDALAEYPDYLAAHSLKANIAKEIQDSVSEMQAL